MAATLSNRYILRGAPFSTAPNSNIKSDPNPNENEIHFHNAKRSMIPAVMRVTLLCAPRTRLIAVR
jgi:hypothetical protein